MRVYVLLILTSILSVPDCHCQIDSTGLRGVIPLSRADKKDSSYKPYYQESFALIIGASEYKNRWSPLPGAARDADSLEKVLRNHGFKTTVLRDPRFPLQLKTELMQFFYKADNNRDNRIIIYYAGHGYVNKESAYLVMTEGIDNRSENNEDALQEIPFTKHSSFLDLMEVFRIMGDNMYSKHVLLVLDGCFLGKASDFIQKNQFFATTPNDMPPMIKKYLGAPGRFLLTSSTRDKSVPDISIFCEYFLKGINGEADLIKDGYITLSELKVYLQQNVGNISEGNQIIYLGRMMDSRIPVELDNTYGEIIFFKPRQ